MGFLPGQRVMPSTWHISAAWRCYRKAPGSDGDACNMKPLNLIIAAVPVLLVWIAHFVAPGTVPLGGALGVSAAAAGYPIGMYFRQKRAAQAPVRATESGQSVFPVRRRAMMSLGCFLVALGVAGSALVLIKGTEDRMLLLSIPVAVAFGVYFIIAARNVREIRIDDSRIQFWPVGASLPLNEVSAITTPSDKPAPAHIELTTRTKRNRLVPGALMQRDGRCRLSVVGSNGAAVLAALRQRLPSA